MGRFSELTTSTLMQPHLRTLAAFARVPSPRAHRDDRVLVGVTMFPDWNSVRVPSSPGRAINPCSLGPGHDADCRRVDNCAAALGSGRASSQVRTAHRSGLLLSSGSWVRVLPGALSGSE